MIAVKSWGNIWISQEYLWVFPNFSHNPRSLCSASRHHFYVDESRPILKGRILSVRLQGGHLDVSLFATGSDGKHNFWWFIALFKNILIASTYLRKPSGFKHGSLEGKRNDSPTTYLPSSSVHPRVSQLAMHPRDSKRTFAHPRKVCLYNILNF